LSKFQDLNFEYFIARHIAPDKSENYAKPVVRISFVSIALGLALMIVSIAVVVGFKNSISAKIIGFTAHLQIVPFDNNESAEETPLTADTLLLQKLRSQKDIVHVQLTARKAAVLKTGDQIQGVVLKGIGPDYRTDFLEESLIEGRLPDVFAENRTDEVMVSQYLADLLHLKPGDDLRAWFITGEEARARGRKFVISGIYKTSLEEFDSRFIIGDIRHIRRLNGWGNDQAGSIEVYLNDEDHLRETALELHRTTPYDMRVLTVLDEYPQIFNWLELLDMNVIVILVLLVSVSAITMISTLLVLIIERTRMVGLLKALGAENGSIRRIFLYKAGYIILRGMIWGNLIGLAFYFLQYHFRIIGLSPEDYYVDYVPVELNWLYWVLLNIGTLAICLLMLIAPSVYISRVIPARALRYE
jgi:lipoprotein-releasing system permease protein